MAIEEDGAGSAPATEGVPAATGVATPGQTSGVAEPMTGSEIAKTLEQPGSETASQQQQRKSFHRWEREDGEPMEFETQADLNRYLREGTLRWDNFTKKTQGFSEERKRFDQERESLQAEKTAYLQMKAKYDAWDEKLKRLSPEQFERVYQQVTGQVQSAARDEMPQWAKELQEKQTRQEQAEAQSRAEREAGERRERAFEVLSKRYGADFQKDAVSKEIERLMQVPEGLETEALTEIVHFALLGKQRASQMAGRVAGQLQSSYQALPGAGSSLPGDVVPRNESVPDTWDEATRRAKRDLGISVD